MIKARRELEALTALQALKAQPHERHPQPQPGRQAVQRQLNQMSLSPERPVRGSHLPQAGHLQTVALLRKALPSLRRTHPLPQAPAVRQTTRLLLYCRPLPKAKVRQLIFFLDPLRRAPASVDALRPGLQVR